MTFLKVCKVSDVKPGEGKTLEVGSHAIAVFNDNGHFYAIDNACPHRKGPLGEGVLDGDVVACPWHGWRFNVKTGKCINMPVSVNCYEVKIEDGHVLVKL